MITFIWTDLAKYDYWNNIDYLLEKWTEKEALVFIKKVDRNLDIIKHNPKTFAKTGYKNTRCVVISSQISLYYKIADKQTVELLRFWNTYQNPKSLRF